MQFFRCESYWGHGEEARKSDQEILSGRSYWEGWKNRVLKTLWAQDLSVNIGCSSNFGSGASCSVSELSQPKPRVFVLTFGSATMNFDETSIDPSGRGVKESTRSLLAVFRRTGLTFLVSSTNSGLRSSWNWLLNKRPRSILQRFPTNFLVLSIDIAPECI